MLLFLIFQGILQLGNEEKKDLGGSLPRISKNSLSDLLAMSGVIKDCILDKIYEHAILTCASYIS